MTPVTKQVVCSFGDPRLPPRVWARATQDAHGCWLWGGAVAGEGYGKVTYPKGVPDYLHRISYRAFVGPTVDGLHIDHLCNVRLCFNPRDLKQVTPRENVLRSNGLSARAARATHCPAGHPYAGANLYVTPRGERGCMECRRVARRDSYHRVRGSL